MAFAVMLPHISLKGELSFTVQSKFVLLKPVFQREKNVLHKSLTWYTYAVTKSVNLKLRKNNVRWHTCQHVKTPEQNNCAKTHYFPNSMKLCSERALCSTAGPNVPIVVQDHNCTCHFNFITPWFPNVSKYNLNIFLVILCFWWAYL